jgi:hypothetical protein
VPLATAKPSKGRRLAEKLLSEPRESLALLVAPQSPINVSLEELVSYLNQPRGTAGPSQPKALSTITQAQVIEDFNLSLPVAPLFSTCDPVRWVPQDPTTPVKVSPCLERFLWSYQKNFQRSSEALCRTAIDIMLNEALFCFSMFAPPPEVV